MDKVLSAIKGSVKKWQDIVDGTKGDLGGDNCDLCQLYFANHCDGCPILVKTGESCVDVGSVYAKWSNHQEFVHDAFKYCIFAVEPDCAECKRLAENMLNFLKEIEREYEEGK